MGEFRCPNDGNRRHGDVCMQTLADKIEVMENNGKCSAHEDFVKGISYLKGTISMVLLVQGTILALVLYHLKGSM